MQTNEHTASAIWLVLVRKKALKKLTSCLYPTNKYSSNQMRSFVRLTPIFKTPTFLGAQSLALRNSKGLTNETDIFHRWGNKEGVINAWGDCCLLKKRARSNKEKSDGRKPPMEVSCFSLRAICSLPLCLWWGRRSKDRINGARLVADEGDDRKAIQRRRLCLIGINKMPSLLSVSISRRYLLATHVRSHALLNAAIIKINIF